MSQVKRNASGLAHGLMSSCRKPQSLPVMTMSPALLKYPLLLGLGLLSGRTRKLATLGLVGYVGHLAFRAATNQNS